MIRKIEHRSGVHRIVHIIGVLTEQVNRIVLGTVAQEVAVSGTQIGTENSGMYNDTQSIHALW